MISVTSKLWIVILVSATVIHALVAYGLYQTLNPEHPTPGQQLMERYVPDEIWPILFALCSFFALCGLRHLRCAQFHFILAGMLMLAWAIVSLSTPSPVVNVGGVLLIHFALLKFALAYYSPALQQAHRATDKLMIEVGHARDDLEREHLASGQ